MAVAGSFVARETGNDYIGLEFADDPNNIA